MSGDAAAGSNVVPSLRAAGAGEGGSAGSVRLAAAGGGSVKLAAQGPSGAVDVEGGIIRSAEGGDE